MLHRPRTPLEPLRLTPNVSSKYSRDSGLLQRPFPPKGGHGGSLVGSNTSGGPTDRIHDRVRAAMRRGTPERPGSAARGRGARGRAPGRAVRRPVAQERSRAARRRPAPHVPRGLIRDGGPACQRGLAGGRSRRQRSVHPDQGSRRFPILGPDAALIHACSHSTPCIVPAIPGDRVDARRAQAAR